MIEQMEVVKKVLSNLGANKNMITVYNKIDTVKDSSLLPNERPNVMISALKREGMEELLELIQENLPRKIHHIYLLVPYDQGNIRSMLHEEGNILAEDFVETGIQMEVEVDDVLYGRVKSFLQIV